mmetsp:Transcript_24642/g.97305  ORF Transcript_24642/g.97305 Transcript_24642/m.97305 type:complete len:89 (+) Transcript_24642:528-794(+)
MVGVIYCTTFQGKDSPMRSSGQLLLADSDSTSASEKVVLVSRSKNYFYRISRSGITRTRGKRNFVPFLSYSSTPLRKPVQGVIFVISR